MQSQDFIVHPSGLVRGGFASYQADLATGDIHYQASVKRPWPLSPLQTKGEYKVDPADLKSAKLAKVGDTLVIGNVTFTVLSLIPGKKAVVGMQVFGQHMTGQAALDTTGEYLQVDQLLAKAQIGPVSVDLDVEPA